MADQPGMNGQHPATALLIIDMINKLDFEEGPVLLEQALPVARRIAALKRRLKAEGVPVIYVNDNFTQWRSDFREIVKACLEPTSRGAPLAALLAPDDDDYFVLKPRHSAFYATPLAVLLEQIGIRHTVITGIAGDSCVLSSAADAKVREYEVHVPSDCIASITPERNRTALALMETAMHLDTRPSDAVEARPPEKPASGS